MNPLIFAGNWKMHLGPVEAAAFLDRFLDSYVPRDDREVWFYTPAVSLSTVAARIAERVGLRVGAQHVHWEAKGAFTGETSVSMAAEAGATSTLIGHSERRHVFGETDEATGAKVRAALAGGLLPMLCVGETLAQRDAGQTLDVVRRQLAVLEGLAPAQLAQVPIAYEPVWAIGTGKNATPADAAAVHTVVRETMAGMGAPRVSVRVLYGGSVKPANVGALVAESEIDGVLVGGASIDADSWLAITGSDRD
ncbi:MAG TPA: triose-phosphate isomerase [Gemmatimonadales bacterium]